ncbi:hypothetical protein STFR1_110063 [Bacillus vallismortis]
MHYYLQGGILLFVAAKQGNDQKRNSKKLLTSLSQRVIIIKSLKRSRRTK